MLQDDCGLLPKTFVRTKADFYIYTSFTSRESTSRFEMSLDYENQFWAHVENAPFVPKVKHVEIGTVETDRVKARDWDVKSDWMAPV